MDAPLLLSMLTVAYGASGVLGLIGYLPQFKVYVKNKRACLDAPIATWVLWVVQTGAVLGYAVGVNGDWLFIAMSATSFTACSTGLGLVVRGRMQDRVIRGGNVVLLDNTRRVA